MQVILTKRVRNLGNVGDIVSIKPGFGRNYLIPMQMAVRASKANLEQFEQRREEFEKAELELLTQAKTRAEQIRGMSLTIAAQAADEGKLYGSVNTREVVVAMAAAGIKIEKAEVNLPEGPIRFIGEYPVQIVLHPEVEAEFTLTVIEEK